jgi:hypothetical protein
MDRSVEKDPLFPHWIGAALVAALMVAYVAGYAWSAPNTDTADELVHAYTIRHGLSYPVEGPFLGGAIHLGPAWFYLIALPLWISSTWLAVALFIGTICAFKFALAYHCGRRLIDHDFGVLWAVAMFVPGWSTIEELVFLNPNAVAAATLLVLAICLRGISRPLRLSAFAALGMALALAIHVHPTSIPIFVLAAGVFWAHHQRGQRIIGALFAAGVGFILPFLPYIVNEILTGFPDWGSASGYVADQVSLANIVNTPSVLANYMIAGPATMAQYLMGWEPDSAMWLGVIFAAATVLCVAALRRPGRGRRTFLALVAALLLFGAWIACMRPTTPVQFVWVLNPVFGGLIAIGLWSLSRNRRLRPIVAAMVVASIAFNCLMIGAMARAVDEGEGHLPSLILDIKDRIPRTVYRDIWFPALGHGDLGRLLCSSVGPASLHGHLAQVFDRDLGLDTLFECGDRSRFVLVASNATTHYFAMTRPFWKALSWQPDCWIGSLGFAMDSRPLLDRKGIAVADGSTYLPRKAARHPAQTTVLAVTAPANAAVLVTNVLAGYEQLQILSAMADARERPPAAKNDLSFLYRPPERAGADVAWTFTILSTNPEAVDIVSVEGHSQAGREVPECIPAR